MQFKSILEYLESMEDEMDGLKGINSTQFLPKKGESVQLLSVKQHFQQHFQQHFEGVAQHFKQHFE